MADTERSLSALQTLLADNSTQDISPQDLRDMLVSLVPPYGSYSVTTPAATVISVAGTLQKINGTTTAGSLRNFSMSANNRLLYTGVPDRHFHVACSLSFSASANNQVCRVAMAKNGTAIAASMVELKLGTGGDINSTALHADMMLSTNDYIEIFCTDDTSTATLTFDHMYLFAMGMTV